MELRDYTILCTTRGLYRHFRLVVPRQVVRQARRLAQGHAVKGNPES